MHNPLIEGLVAAENLTHSLHHVGHVFVINRELIMKLLRVGYKAIEADPSLRSPRAQRDEWLKEEIRRVWKQNRKLYGAEKVWKQLNREGIRVAWCTVRRLMKEVGLEGAVRGRAFKTTTIPGEEASRPLEPGALGGKS